MRLPPTLLWHSEIVKQAVWPNHFILLQRGPVGTIGPLFGTGFEFFQ